jgi:hypothetical protein
MEEQFLGAHIRAHTVTWCDVQSRKGVRKVRVNPRVQYCTLRHITELSLATTAYDPVQEKRRREKHTCGMPYRLGWATCPFHRVQTRPLGRVTSHSHHYSHLDSQNGSTAPETTYNLSSYAMYVVVSFVRCALSSST